MAAKRMVVALCVLAVLCATAPVRASIIQQGTKLVGTGAIGAAEQGYSVAVSADGNTAVVGGRNDNGNVGAMWVYTRSGGAWSQQGPKLVGTGAVGTARQGSSVAVSADGNTAVVGGSGDAGGMGAVWVFTRSAGVWSQQGAKLVGTGGSGSNQGVSVAASADGNTVVVGGWIDNAGVGAVWVFTRVAGVWSQQGAKLVGTGGNFASQGLSVAVSADGNTAVVGGQNDNSNVGAAWVYRRNAGVWSQEGSKLVGAGAVGAAQQAWSVAVSADGNTVVVGGKSDNGALGAAWVYVEGRPKIVAIRDIPNDQGGKVSVRWTSSLLDNAPANPIAEYWIWRQVPVHMAAGKLADQRAIRRQRSIALAAGWRAVRTTIEQGQVYYWEFVGSQVAHGFPAYSFTAQTLFDSIPGSNPYTLFMVEAEKPSTGEYWSSTPDSGYSVDNLAPGMPALVAAVYSDGATHLHWGVSPEADFLLYRVHRGGSTSFVPGPSNLVTSQPDTGYSDLGAAGNYYKLSAIDTHGNESSFALVTPAATTGVGGDGPVAFALEGVRTNPARADGVRVTFALTNGAPAHLELLDINGRRVCSTEVGLLGTGSHTVNLSEGRKVPPGLYWVRLTQGANQGTTRVSILD